LQCCGAREAVVGVVDGDDSVDAAYSSRVLWWRVRDGWGPTVLSERVTSVCIPRAQIERTGFRR
jgi:hypothetical protein